MVAALLFPTSARGQACASRADVVERLAGKYREAPIAIAMEQNGNVIEVFVSANGTWTIIVTTPGGTTCLVASGGHWQAIPFKIPKGEKS